MILHFLKRDFLDFWLLWTGLCICTILLVIGSLWVFTEPDWSYLFLGSYFFGLLPQNYILGSPWRTQHQMSRHYLLSLPLGHKTLFLIQNIRLMVFWLPALVVGGVFPFLGSPLFDDFYLLDWIFFYLGLVVSIGFMKQSGIWTMLEWERLTGYILPSDRFWSYLKIFGVSIGGMMVLFWAWADILLLNFRFTLLFLPQIYQPFSTIKFPHIVFMLGFFLLAFWIPRNARRWCVSL